MHMTYEANRSPRLAHVLLPWWGAIKLQLMFRRRCGASKLRFQHGARRILCSDVFPHALTCVAALLTDRSTLGVRPDFVSANCIHVWKRNRPECSANGALIHSYTMLTKTIVLSEFDRDPPRKEGALFTRCLVVFPEGF